MLFYYATVVYSLDFSSNFVLVTMSRIMPLQLIKANKLTSTHSLASFVTRPLYSIVLHWGYKIVACEAHGKCLEPRLKQHPFCANLAVKWMFIQSKAK